MADRPNEPASARRSSNSGREDTVVTRLPGQPASPETQTGNRKVLPPMPPGEDVGSSRNGSPNGAPATASTPSAPAKPAKRPAKPPARPKPAQPPAQPSAQARKAPAKPAAAPSRGRTAPPSPAARPTAPTPTVATPTVAAPPVVHPAAPVSPVAVPPEAKVKPAKQTKPPKPAKPTREERRAAKQAAAPKPGRRARLRLTRIDPWSVMKTSFLLSIALGIVTVVSVLMVWTVLDAADVWTSINQTVQDVVGGQDTSTFDIENYLGTRRVVGFMMIVAAVDVVLLTAICTLGAFLYNMSASLLGGVEVTLAEDN